MKINIRQCGVSSGCSSPTQRPWARRRGHHYCLWPVRRRRINLPMFPNMAFILCCTASNMWNDIRARMSNFISPSQFVTVHNSYTTTVSEQFRTEQDFLILIMRLKSKVTAGNFSAAHLIRPSARAITVAVVAAKCRRRPGVYQYQCIISISTWRHKWRHQRSRRSMVLHDGANWSLPADRRLKPAV